MKPPQRIGDPSVTSFLVGRLLPVILACAVPPVAAAQAGAGTSEPKTHTLFLGADLSLERNQKQFRVQDLVGEAFVIKVDGKEVRIPVDQQGLKLQVQTTLKLSEAAVTVANLKGERAFTPANDPALKARQAMAMAQLDYAESQHAQREAEERQAVMESRTDAAASQAEAQAAGMIGKSKFEEQHDAAAAETNASSAAPGTAFGSHRRSVADDQAFDAMKLDFEVSADRPLGHPYVVVVVRYRKPEAKAGQVGNWICAKALPPLTRDVKKVHILQGGLPRGFELLDFQVRLYQQGEEIATSVSPKRVPLTRDEAFQYGLVEYLNSHKDATLPATPALGKLPDDWPARVAGGQFKGTYYIRVTKAGAPTGLFTDQACSQKVADPYLESAIKNLRFHPALQKGKPVDGVAAVNLAELAF
jgi:hypothetical protein